MKLSTCLARSLCHNLLAGLVLVTLLFYINTVGKEVHRQELPAGLIECFNQWTGQIKTLTKSESDHGKCPIPERMDSKP